MRILLIGEYSRLHYTLAEALRHLGHHVVVASDGDGFKNYPRDVDLTRKSSGVIDTFSCLFSTISKFRLFVDYDVVQIINPCFTTLNVHVNGYLYNMLKRNNRKVFLGAFGDDSYWVKACAEDRIFKYSEFFVDGKSTELEYNKGLVAKWLNSPRKKLNEKIAKSCNGIVACLYEYYKSYEPFFFQKLAYIPLPINTSQIECQPISEIPERINFFIGINKDRSEYKGTDIMERALLQLAEKYPVRVNVIRVESVSYEEYVKRMSEAHIVLDQLYSHSPAMNALLAMSQGKVIVGGGEPEMYGLMHESENMPIVNVYPTQQDVFEKLENIVLNPQFLIDQSKKSREFVEKHHHYLRVARLYLQFWEEH